MIIVKAGGGKKIRLDYILQDFAQVQGKKIFVHGANNQLEILAKKLNFKMDFIKSRTGQISRYTNPKVLELIYMVYCGKVNKKIVEQLQTLGVNALGLSGLDGQLVIAKKNAFTIGVLNNRLKVIRDDQTGQIIRINTELLTSIINFGIVPVITVPAIDDSGQAINVDGDKLACEIAISLKADRLVYLTEEKGVLKNFEKNKNDYFKVISSQNYYQALTSAQGRMKKKIIAAKKTSSFGIKVYIGSGVTKNPIKNLLKESTIFKL